MNSTSLGALTDVLYGGIDPNIPGHGGEECARYLSPRTMILETVLSTTMMITVGVIGMKTYSMPKTFPRFDNFLSKRLLLAALCLVFGVEIGYKICSRQVLYLLNPCHIITAFEIILLTMRPSKLSFSMLRILIHYVYAALIAILFPDTYARLFPGEVALYWIQHTLIFFIVPPYLVYIWGPDSLEPFTEWAWSLFSGILFGIHHHYILQPLALLTHVNLNFMLCPANVDPFNGPYYRTAAIFHQTLCLLVSGKIYTLIIKLILKLLPKYQPEKQKGQ